MSSVSPFLWNTVYMQYMYACFYVEQALWLEMWFVYSTGKSPSDDAC